MEVLNDILTCDKRKQKSLIKVLSFMRHQASIELSTPDNTSRPSTSYIEQEYGAYFRQRFFHKLFPPVKRGYGFKDGAKVVSTHSILSVIDFVYKLIDTFTGESRIKLLEIFKVTFGTLHDRFIGFFVAQQRFLDYFKQKLEGLSPASVSRTARRGSTILPELRLTS